MKHVYHRIPFGSDSSDTNLPEALTRKQVEIPDGEHEREVEKRPKVWYILTAKGAGKS